MAVTDLMVDLETLDIKPTAVVLSVGLVAFNRRDPGEVMHYYYGSFGTKALRDEQINVGRTVSKDTVEWWKKQSPEAKKVFREATVKSVESALLRISMFFDRFDSKVDLLVWGNSCSFDLGILGDLYRTYNVEIPWKFWNERCFRTMKGEHGHIAKPPERYIEHDAVDDARYQAKYLQNIYQELQSYGIESHKQKERNKR